MAWRRVAALPRLASPRPAQRGDVEEGDTATVWPLCPALRAGGCCRARRWRPSPSARATRCTWATTWRCSRCAWTRTTSPASRTCSSAGTRTAATATRCGASGGRRLRSRGVFASRTNVPDLRRLLRGAGKAEDVARRRNGGRACACGGAGRSADGRVLVALTVRAGLCLCCARGGCAVRSGSAGLASSEARHGVFTLHAVHGRHGQRPSSCSPAFCPCSRLAPLGAAGGLQPCSLSLATLVTVEPPVPILTTRQKEVRLSTMATPVAGLCTTPRAAASALLPTVRHASHAHTSRYPRTRLKEQNLVAQQQSRKSSSARKRGAAALLPACHTVQKMASFPSRRARLNQASRTDHATSRKAVRPTLHARGERDVAANTAA